MISMAEVALRASRKEWLEAKAKWVQALSDVNAAKNAWEAAQEKFYADRNVMSSAAACGSCSGCSTGGGCK